MLGLISLGSAKNRRWVRWKLKYLTASGVENIFAKNY